MRLPAFVLASLVYVSLMISSVPALAQDLGGGRGRLIEGGPVDLEQLVQRAGLIVHGSVVRKEPRWIGRVIYTHYELLVQQTLKGPVRGSVIAAVVGGALGNVQLTVPGSPDLSIGDELVFFGQPLNAGGVGLGLSLVRQIATRHGGKARCESRDGGGSCFSVRIPMPDPAQAVQTARPVRRRTA